MASEREANEPGKRETLAAAAAALRDGALVGLPTETVYGLAARADDPRAIERLREVKGRAATHTFTIHLPDADAGAAYVSRWLLPARRLASRFWPGPLTLVMPASPHVPHAAVSEGVDGAWVGLRVPADDRTRAVLRDVGAPVVMTSANRSGEPAAPSLREVPDAIRRQLAVAIDGPRPSLGQASSILRVGPRRFEVEREGILTRDDLRRAAGVRVLFVCTGNTCRSPLTEVYFRKRLLLELGGDPAAPRAAQDVFLDAFGFAVGSAGLAAAIGSSASEGAVDAAAEAGLSLAEHRARDLTFDLFERFDRVYGMSARHVDELRRLAPAGTIVERLDPDDDIVDPFGGPPEAYRAALERIVASVDRRLRALAGD
ncbi:MAG TPA: L-threonylcarbamoyladenylate synthase [Planctomycetota bacterium]|nr:L-threonylcarbamoyladenylate synthase [Planctomycetota bacterium]